VKSQHECKHIRAAAARAEEKNNLIKKPFPKAKWIIMDKTTQLDQESSLAVI